MQITRTFKVYTAYACLIHISDGQAVAEPVSQVTYVSLSGSEEAAREAFLNEGIEIDPKCVITIEKVGERKYAMDAMTFLEQADLVSETNMEPTANGAEE